MKYCNNMPSWFYRYVTTEAMQRISDVGMNCGCEYTSFSRFQNLKEYSRLQHSIGVAEIVWNFTGSSEQTLAALFHDIATPVFAHTIDFLNGDYTTQESTEKDTEKVIVQDIGILYLLEKQMISVSNVSDYHRYSIADNDSPRLSADRLEYTLGNALRYHFDDDDSLQKIYNDLIVSDEPEGVPELCFSTVSCASHFAKLSLQCSKVYISDEDRYAMQILSEIVKKAMDCGCLIPEDLLTTETNVIEKMICDPIMSVEWNRFRNLHEMILSDDNRFQKNARMILAKKRYIDPYIIGFGRLSDVEPNYRIAINRFREQSFDYKIAAI